MYKLYNKLLHNNSIELVADRRLKSLQIQPVELSDLVTEPFVTGLKTTYRFTLSAEEKFKQHNNAG